MKHYQRKSNIQAFTLLELLLAIVLTAIIILVATAAINGLTRNSNTVDRNDRVFSEAMFFMDLLARDLANIVSDTEGHKVLEIIPGGTDSQPFDRLLLLRNADPANDSELAVYARVEYGMLVDDKVADCLARRVAAVDDLDNDNPNGRLFVLSEPVMSLKFEVYDGSSWLRGVIPDNIKPVMIKVTLQTLTTLWKQKEPFIIRQIPVYPHIINSLQ